MLVGVCCVEVSNLRELWWLLVSGVVDVVIFSELVGSLV